MRSWSKQMAAATAVAALAVFGVGCEIDEGDLDPGLEENGELGD